MNLKKRILNKNILYQPYIHKHYLTNLIHNKDIYLIYIKKNHYILNIYSLIQIVKLKLFYNFIINKFIIFKALIHNIFKCNLQLQYNLFKNINYQYKTPIILQNKLLSLNINNYLYYLNIIIGNNMHKLYLSTLMFIEGYIKDNTYIYLNLLNNLKQFNYIKYITINNTLFIENNYKTIHTSFISRTRKGGRFRRFKVLIISGNKNGWVSLGIGKNKYLNEALNQALFNINNNVILIGKNSQGHLNLFNKVKYKKSFILIKQRPLGFGNKGSNVVQNIFELGGVKDVLCKQLGSSNKLNTVKNIFNIFINKNVFKYKKDSIFKIFNYIY